MSLNPWWDEIAQLTGSAVRSDAGKANLLDELLGGAWWTACERAAVTNSPWLVEITLDHPALQLLADFEPGAEIRALAAAYAADAGRRQRHDLPGSERALAAAACLWAGDILPDDHDEPQPKWAWAPVEDLAARIQLTDAKTPQTTRLAVSIPDGVGKPSVGNLCLTPTDDGQILADPVTMMFADIDPTVITEIDHAWHWAVNRDRFQPGRGCRWSIVNGAGRPERYLPELAVGAVAAVALGYAFHLMRGTRRAPRRDALVFAGMLRSGALTPADDDVPNPPAGGRMIVHPRQNRTDLPEVVKVRTAATASEAIRHVRRPRYFLMTAASVLVVALVAGFFTVLGITSSSDTEQKATASLAAQLAVEADRQYTKAPDRSLELALASYRLAPGSAQTQAAVLQAMYRDPRFGGILPTAAETLSALAMSDHATAAGMEDGSISVYDENTHRATHTDHDHAGAIISLVFSPNSRLMASSGKDGKIVVRDGQQPPVKLQGSGVLAFSPDSRLLASASADGTLIVNDLTTGSANTLDHRHAHIESVAFVSPTVVAAGGDDKRVVLYDVATSKPVATLSTDSSVTSVTSDGKGASFLFTDFAGNLHYGDPRTSKETHAPEPLTIGARATLRAGHGLVVQSPVGIAEFYATEPTSSDHLSLSSPLYPAGGGKGLLAVSPDGKRIAYPSASGAILLWHDPRDDGSLRRIYDLTSGFPVPNTDLLLVSAGGLIITRSELALIRRDGHVVTTQTVDPLNGVFNPPLTYSTRFRLVTAAGKGTATILRVDGEKLQKVADLKRTTKDGAITAITIDEPHSRILIARSRVVTAIAIETVDHPTERQLYRTETRINLILPFPSGHNLGLVTLDGLAVLPVGPDGFVNGNGEFLSRKIFTQAVVADDNTLAVATIDGSISSYTRVNGTWPETRLQGHQGNVYGLSVFDDLAVSTGQDGHVIVSAAHDGRTIVDIRLAQASLPHTVWRDGDTIRVSHSSPIGAEAIFILAPTAAAKAACAMGVRALTVGDLTFNASSANKGIPLCPIS
ncbi:WD40 repeat domain-containing protein [Amycolatopsis sp. cmx-4-68]|uniref:WD40 repeat domain-containing protein n=1 Tax=Amycolatopsis sp. cmx-4-68 TaxID=2790938 RepID=UPI003977EB3A